MTHEVWHCLRPETPERLLSWTTLWIPPHFSCLTWWEKEQHLVVIDSDICSVPCYRLRQWRRGGSNTRKRHNKWDSGSGTDSREGVISPPAHFTVQLSLEPREASARTSPPFCISACRQTLENTGRERERNALNFTPLLNQSFFHCHNVEILWETKFWSVHSGCSLADRLS